MKKLCLSLLIFSLFPLFISAQEEQFPLEVSRVVIKISEGKPIVSYKDFKKEEVGQVNFYYFKTFRNTNSFYPEQIKKSIEAELVRQEFKVEGWGGLFPELDRQIEPKMAIGAIVKDFNIYVNAINARANFKLKIEIEKLINWQILDLETNQIVYNQDIKSVFYTPDGIVQASKSGSAYFDFSGAIDSSFIKAVNDLLNDPEFQSLLQKKKQEKSLSQDTTVIRIPKVALANSSRFLEQAIQATVTIKSPLGFGSGFFINNKGLILTCYHNFKKSKPVKVYLNQSIATEAEVVKVSPEYDLALLQIKEIESAPLTIGQDTKSKTGAEVYVIGTPANEVLSQSVSGGILSGKRTVESKQYLQTDASVSPGNSGGPMINEKGEVIGIVNAKVVSYGAEGIGFAIPIEVALEQLNIKVE